MADTSTKVLTVDTGGAITNVKEFKDKIEELKGTLLGLEKGTEEYNSVAKELRDSQQKLTEVMDVAKGKADAVEGSYDNLVATMKELKTAWRATANEAERTDLGSKILDINNKLKDLDASTGNFQRNVGDYQNAFEEAFKNILGSVGSVNSELANSTKTIVQLIPLIKKAATAATVGLNATKKALVSTGIGALVVAVGLIAANWDKVSAAIMKSTKNGKELLAAEEKIETVSASIKRIQEESAEATDFQTRLMRAQGKTQEEILEYEVAQLKIQKSKLQAKRDELGLVFQEAQAKVEQLVADDKAEWRINRAAKARDKALEAMNEGNKALKKVNDELAIAEATIETIRRKGDIEINVKTKVSTGGKNKGEEGESYVKKELDEYYKEIAKLRNPVKAALDELEKEYNESLKKINEDTKASEAEREELRNAKTKKYLDARLKIVLDAQKEEWNKFKEHQDRMNETQKEIAEGLINEQKRAYQNALAEAELEAKKFEALSKIPWNPLEKAFGKDEVWLGNLKETFDKAEKALEERKEKLIESLEFEISQRNDMGAFMDPESKEYADNMAKIVELQRQMKEAEVKYVIESAELEDKAEEELHKRRMQRMQDLGNMFTSLGTLTNNLASLMEEQINSEVEAGKISEETAKERFESVKKMQIGAAVINMAAGVVAAIAGAMELGPIMGPIMAAINSAAVIAAGAVEISQIKRTKYGSDSSANVSTPNLSRASNMVQIQPVQNITGQSELTELSNAINSKPIVVKVTDIEDTQAIQNATTAEATF